MAKLFSMFLVLIAIQAVLIIFVGQEAVNTDIWNFITNMSEWGTLDFILAIVGLTGIGLVGVAAASAFGFKSDFIILAAAIPGLISIGAVFTNLATFVYSQVNGLFFPTCADPCFKTTFLVAMTIGPIALYYVWTVLEWWRGKDGNY